MDRPRRADRGPAHAEVFAVIRPWRCEISVGWGLLSRCEHAAPEARQVYVVADRKPWAHHGDVLLAALARRRCRCRVLEVTGGERVKTWSSALHVADWLLREGARRRDLVLAVGGGTITDLVGFVASCYMRGVPYANVPTSLLAQVDAGVGGKVAVNHPLAKNLLGAFHHPVAVVIDPGVLLTQPARSYRSGLAEVVKMAVIGRPSLFRLLERRGKEIAARSDPDLLARLVGEAVRLKVALLRGDPFERQLDRPLNLGHTVAHALETASGYRRLPHGEAVSVGLVAAARVGMGRGLCPRETGDRIIALLQSLRLPTELPTLNGDRGAIKGDRGAIIRRALCRCLDRIALVRDGDLRVVVPVEIGRVRILHDVGADEIVGALC